jgi:phage-related protein
MSHGERWTVGRYLTPAGEAPVTAFLDSLTGVNRDQAFALLGLLEQLGNAIRPPRSKQVEPGIWELRGHQVRLFYTFRPGRRIVLLDGMIKKTDESPREVLRRLRGYLRDVEAIERRSGSP